MTRNTARSRKILRKYKRRMRRLKIEGMILGILILVYVAFQIVSNAFIFKPVKALANEDREVVVVEKPVPTTVPVFDPTTQNIVNFYAQKYGVSANEMTCTLKNESGYRKDATNNSSTATGMAQILVGTWIGWRTDMGEDTNPNLRFDAVESIKTLAWAFSKNKQSAWVAWQTHCQGVK